MSEIGATLREARMRAHIDVSEIEATTKIRAKYLRALENEEWGLLPGPTFVKSFLRTYAQALGLDAKAILEEYRLHHEGLSEAALEPIVSTPQRAGRNRGRAGSDEGSSRGYMVTVGVIGLVIVVLIVLLVSGGGSSTNTTSTATSATAHKHASHSAHHGRETHLQQGATSASSNIVALSLRASGLVYVCLIGEHGRKLIPGTDLQPGEGTPTYHAKHFAITLGNSSVTMFIDGRARSVPPSSQAIGYSLTRTRGRQSLSSGELPSCQ
jgi:cytoskeleton protein RodZ